MFFSGLLSLACTPSSPEEFNIHYQSVSAKPVVELVHGICQALDHFDERQQQVNLPQYAASGWPSNMSTDLYQEHLSRYHYLTGRLCDDPQLISKNMGLRLARQSVDHEYGHSLWQRVDFFDAQDPISKSAQFTAANLMPASSQATSQRNLDPRYLDESSYMSMSFGNDAGVMGLYQKDQQYPVSYDNFDHFGVQPPHTDIPDARFYYSSDGVTQSYHGDDMLIVDTTNPDGFEAADDYYEAFGESIEDAQSEVNEFMGEMGCEDVCLVEVE